MLEPVRPTTWQKEWFRVSYRGPDRIRKKKAKAEAKEENWKCAMLHDALREAFKTTTWHPPGAISSRLQVFRGPANPGLLRAYYYGHA